METEHDSVNAKIYFFNFLSLINILATYQDITKITSGLDTRNFFTWLLAQFLNLLLRSASLSNAMAIVRICANFAL